MEEFSYDELETATNGFAVETMIGKGSHGRVHKAILNNGRQVAVKMINPSPCLQQTNGVISILEKEVEILSSIQSPNIVNLIGTCKYRGSQEKMPALLVMEFMPNRSLHDLLHKSPDPPDWRRRLKFALQIAKALQFLHESVPPVIHRDVKSSNVLLDSSGDAKLADFSLAVRAVGTASDHVPAGTIGYLDPCYTGPTKLSTRNDMFSYGVLLLELISGRPAMDTTSDTTSIVAWSAPFINSGRSLDLCDRRISLASSKLSSAIAMIIVMARRCVCLEEDLRPSAAEIVAKLQPLVDQLEQRTSWSRARRYLGRRIQKCVVAWRMRKSNRIMATTARIIWRSKVVGAQRRFAVAASLRRW